MESSAWSAPRSSSAVSSFQPASRASRRSTPPASRARRSTLRGRHAARGGSLEERALDGRIGLALQAIRQLQQRRRVLHARFLRELAALDLDLLRRGVSGDQRLQRQLRRGADQAGREVEVLAHQPPQPPEGGEEEAQEAPLVLAGEHQRGLRIGTREQVAPAGGRLDRPGQGLRQALELEPRGTQRPVECAVRREQLEQSRPRQRKEGVRESRPLRGDDQGHRGLLGAGEAAREQLPELLQLGAQRGMRRGLLEARGAQQAGRVPREHRIGADAAELLRDAPHRALRSPRTPGGWEAG